ncbi:MAG: hypothetical protein ACYTG0_39740, partial [Planctomycetota bacterium]
MITSIIRWYAGRFVDEGRSPPWWLRFWMKVDARSRRVFEESISLDRQLRANACQFVDARARELPCAGGHQRPAAQERPIGTGRIAVATAVVAAVVILATAGVWGLLRLARGPGSGDGLPPSSTPESAVASANADEGALMRQKALKFQRLVSDTGAAFAKLGAAARSNSRSVATRLPSIAEGLRADGRTLKAALHGVLKRL